MFARVLNHYSPYLVGLLVMTVGSRTVPVAWGGNRADRERPNFVIVLADDLGYGDLACYGHELIKTPQLDQFAARSLRLTDCYSAAPNCSPSRTGLMTGRTPYRVGIHSWIPMFSPMHVSAREITVATLLRTAGYATCHVGKWHLNGRFNLPGQPQPSDHGFDYWFSTQNNALPTHHNPDNFVRNGTPAGQLTGYSAQLVVDEATKWLREVRDTQKPFFLYVCFHEPHEPIESAPQFTRLYPDDGPRSPFAPDVSAQAAHHGNVSQMDDAFGRLMRFLDELQVSNNTLVWFTSDNGPAITSWHPHGSAGPLRDKKGSLYDGGIRVPGIIRWPGHTTPGQVSHEPVSGLDVLPTLCDIAGIPVPADRAIDGTSIVPILEGGLLAREKPLYWQFNFARSEPKVAMRLGDWKILASLDVPDPQPGGDIRTEDMQSLKRAELATFQLFNMRQDAAEAKDLAQQDSARLQQMAARLSGYYQEVRDESPVWPAWQWPRYEGERIRAHRQQLQK